jgi:multiple antibiotic resistance protein
MMSGFFAPVPVMTEFIKYLALGFSVLLPLINPPAAALELLGVVGVGEVKPYKVLARKIAINTTLFLAIVALAGPYTLQLFGTSIEILQCVGGAVLAAMGWQFLNKPEDARDMKDPSIVQAAADCIALYWQSRAFYPLTFPITVGPGSVAIMLTLSAQAKSLDLGRRIPAFLGLFVCVVVLSAMTYAFCAYAPIATKKLPSPIVHGVLAHCRVFADLQRYANHVARSAFSLVYSKALNHRIRTVSVLVTETWN